MNKNKTILVVEDEAPLSEAVQAKLKYEGFDVVSARTVEQALSYIKDIEIDVVWLDHYLLGKENGLDFVAKVKENERWKKILIFVVSNTASEDKIKSYLALGINRYYIKSNYSLDKIVEEINNCLKRENC